MVVKAPGCPTGGFPFGDDHPSIWCGMPSIDAFREQYFTLRIKERLTPAEARRSLHIHFREAAALEREVQDWVQARAEHGYPVHLRDDEQGDDEPLAPEQLSNEALHALEDFGYFRTRYFGRRPTPWQEIAANQIKDLLTQETKDKQYVTINCPPGSGKSTLFTHDIPCWLAVRNRNLRVMIGSYTERQAVQYVGRLRRTFQRRTTAPDAQSTLIKDFGGFRPLQRDIWRANEFVIAQHGEVDYSEKEPSFAAYGYDSAFLGGRFDFIIWDDLVDRHVLRTPKAMEDLEAWFMTEAMTRIEPGGLFVLQGQRMAPLDLYRFTLNLKWEDGRQQFNHIIFKAHDEDRCQEQHSVDAPYWPEGCLLDPVRVSWKDQGAVKRASNGRYLTLYQQQDIDESMALVRQLWLDGGTDEDGIIRPGCYDRHRGIGELPQIIDQMAGVITVDPSAVNNWAVQLWALTPGSNTRYLIDVYNGPLLISEFLDYSFQSATFSGLLEAWYQRFSSLGLRIHSLVVEINGAQRWLQQSRHYQQWASTRGISLIPHTTGLMKSDPELGVQSLTPLFRDGKIRLPGKGGNNHLQAFIEQHLHYPAGKWTDQVMACWFLEAQWQSVSGRFQKSPSLWRPSWMRNNERGLK